MLQQFTKRVGATLDYSVVWSQWLAANETITASAWTVESGITVVTSTYTDSQGTVWLSGGTTGSNYVAKNSITTSAGRIDHRSIHITIAGE